MNVLTILGVLLRQRCRVIEVSGIPAEFLTLGIVHGDGILCWKENSVLWRRRKNNNGFESLSPSMQSKSVLWNAGKFLPASGWPLRGKKDLSLIQQNSQDLYEIRYYQAVFSLDKASASFTEYQQAALSPCEWEANLISWGKAFIFIKQPYLWAWNIPMISRTEEMLFPPPPQVI